MRKLLSITLGCLAAAASPTGRGDGLREIFESANIAWEDGDYIAALKGYLTVLNAPEGNGYLEAIALQTGELFRTDELTPDGRSPRFSPDGRFIVYDTGTVTAPTVRIVRAAAPYEKVVDLYGTGAVLNAMGQVAYLKTPASGELAAEIAAFEKMATQDPRRPQAQARLNWLRMRDAEIVVHDLATHGESTRASGGLLKSTLLWHPNGQTVLFVGAQEGDGTRSDVYATTDATTPPARLTPEGGFKTSAAIDPTGRMLTYVVTPQNEFRLPEGQGRGGGGRGGPGGPPASPRFGLVRLASGRTTIVDGAAPVFSPDGAALAYIARAGSEYALAVAPLAAETFTPSMFLKGPDRLDAPAFSPDGRRIALQAMVREDWEIKVVDADGKNEVRVTREIQHDVLPRFVGGTRLLGMMGEPRHRRSYLYDLETGARRRLFHNNTLRTIAPEYGWDVNRDGTMILILAERDGDTISPERGVYLVHLDHRVTRDEVIRRLETNLAAETALRDAGRRAFEPIADAVRAAVAEVSTSRIYEYEKALFGFDSKHISRPGNKLAIDYLTATYRSFGYEPEQQWFDAQNALGGKTANVIATLRGTVHPDIVYVVSSHFDSVAAGPGADDDTSGTAALLEAARVMAKRPMPATIVFASFTGEEAGLLGSREFVRRATTAKIHVAGALNNDTIGWANDQRLDNTIRYSNAGIRDIQHAAAMLFTRLVTYDAHYYRSTDAAAFYEAWGDIVGGIGSYPILGSPHYHQPSDVLETINHQLVAETCRTTVASIMLLASSPARVRGVTAARSATGGADVTWTPSPEKDVQAYVVAWGPPGNPMRQRRRVTQPKIGLGFVEPGTHIAVKAVNARGLESWDWARTVVR